MNLLLLLMLLFFSLSCKDKLVDDPTHPPEPEVGEVVIPTPEVKNKTPPI